MNTPRDPALYNYARFRASEYALDSFPGPRPGQLAPDIEVTTLEGERRRLSDLRGSSVVLETGSVTCPQYAARVAAMNAMARRFPDTRFVLLYVREAHPGRRTPAHAAFAAKMCAARRVGPDYDERRELWVDDLEGSAHRALGSLPNVVYVLDAVGVVVFRAEWCDPQAVERALDEMRRGRPEPREGRRFRPVSPPLLVRVLLKGGWDALFDFACGLPRLAFGHAKNLFRG